MPYGMVRCTIHIANAAPQGLMKSRLKVTRDGVKIEADLPEDINLASTKSPYPRRYGEGSVG
jgi:hypothetical protein